MTSRHRTNLVLNICFSEKRYSRTINIGFQSLRFATKEKSSLPTNSPALSCTHFMEHSKEETFTQHTDMEPEVQHPVILIRRKPRNVGKSARTLPFPIIMVSLTHH